MSASSNDQGKTVDVTLRLSVELHQRLLALQATVQSKDLGEVSQNAYRLYEAMVNEAEAGAEFFIKRKGDDAPVPHEVFQK
jgi:hypothetical protein